MILNAVPVNHAKDSYWINSVCIGALHDSIITGSVGMFKLYVKWYNKEEGGKFESKIYDCPYRQRVLFFSTVRRSVTTLKTGHFNINI